jgi:formylmethanofuran dehydrogenase subunit E-like metal-binding protein
MKIIITENQRDRVIEKVVFLYLNKRNYKQFETKDRIYFVENEGDEFAVIRYDKDDEWCAVSSDLTSFLSRLTSTEEPVITEVIGRWVEDTLQMKVSNTRSTLPLPYGWLKIPYK